MQLDPASVNPIVFQSTPCGQLMQAADPPFDRDDSWSNWGVYDINVDSDAPPDGYVPTKSISGFGIQPIRTYRPTNPYEISAAILAAEANGRKTIRAVGSGWSFSDAGVPQNIDGDIQYLIDSGSFASSLQGQLDGILSPQGNHDDYFFVEAGITLEALNVLLDHQKPRKALATLGGSAGQTLGGRFPPGRTAATSTVHLSRTAWRPFSSWAPGDFSIGSSRAPIPIRLPFPQSMPTS
jgi:hypothetical protein